MSQGNETIDANIKKWNIGRGFGWTTYQLIYETDKADYMPKGIIALQVNSFTAKLFLFSWNY